MNLSGEKKNQGRKLTCIDMLEVQPPTEIQEVVLFERARSCEQRRKDDLGIFVNTWNNIKQ